MVIGIVLSKGISQSGKNVFVLYENVKKALNCEVIGILDISSLRMVDGVILQGGDEFLEEDLEIVKYLYDNDIPTLGICLGMQKMGVVINGELGHVLGHKSLDTYCHKIIINKHSKLYDIIKQDEIMVNSRHVDTVLKTDLDVSALDTNGVIEAIEDKNKKFFLGVQWHPESLFMVDEVQKKIFDSFLESCRQKK